MAKGFTDVQQRRSAMERELFSGWQGVVSHERLKVPSAVHQNGPWWDGTNRGDGPALPQSPSTV